MLFSNITATTSATQLILGESYLTQMQENDLMKLTWLSWYAQYDLDLAGEDQAFVPNAPLTINTITDSQSDMIDCS